MTSTASASIAAPERLGPTAGQNRVVVGMDDDPVSVAALRFAATEAAYRGGDVLAVQVWHHPYTSGLTPVWPEEANLGPQIMIQMQQTIAAVQSERVAAGEPAVSISTEVVEGEAADVLHEAACGAALLVLGARHHNRLLGSVSQACTRNPPCTVAVVPTKTVAPQSIEETT